MYHRKKQVGNSDTDASKGEQAGTAYIGATVDLGVAMSKIERSQQKSAKKTYRVTNWREYEAGPRCQGGACKNGINHQSNHSLSKRCPKTVEHQRTTDATYRKIIIYRGGWEVAPLLSNLNRGHEEWTR